METPEHPGVPATETPDPCWSQPRRFGRKSIAIGKGLTTTKPYQFVISGAEEGEQFSAIMTPEEYECLFGLIQRLRRIAPAEPQPVTA